MPAENRSFGLTLAELELAACSGLTGLLTLNLAGIAREESGLLDVYKRQHGNRPQAGGGTGGMGGEGFARRAPRTAVATPAAAIAWTASEAVRRDVYKRQTP